MIGTLVLGARPAMRAAAAFPALFSSMKLMVELMIKRTMIPMKSCQSGGLPCVTDHEATHLSTLSNTPMHGSFYCPDCCRINIITPPLANTMAMMAAISMTHDSGFHMNPRNLRSLLSCYYLKSELQLA